MNSKLRYRNLCKTETSIPLFSRDWWMDTVCGEEKWNVLLVENNEEIVGAMPYFIKSKFGFKYITQPKLTKTNGIWIKYPEEQLMKYQKKISYENNIMFNIIEQLESLNIDYYQQGFHYSITNYFPFYWKNFKQTTYYTYMIEDLKDLNTIYDQFSSNIRKQIRKAKRVVEVKENCSLEEFYKISSMTYERQNEKIKYSLDFFKRIDKACEKSNCRRIFYAVDKDKNIHAVLYLVWDENSATYLLGGGDPKLRNSQAGTLLMWEAIKFASTVTKKFDFEGSMKESIERFFRGFGGVQKRYFVISKNIKKNILFDIRNYINSLLK